ncbi:DAZ-associated protein 2-like [Pteronotus mesoamericanus]|uniref:DAZ-associated protein 2-like n=1 Tax=Pteronotus mesoamericanus TaxID=1884717 RepID=UPI0023EDA6BF|nr:DAZ-associated protein 2-like [Pteronotus parnellii mesoamericanus]
MQPTYPVQPPGNPVYPQILHLPQAPPYAAASPAYSEVYCLSFVHPGAATVPMMSAAFPGTSLYLPMVQSVVVAPLGSTVPMAYYPIGPFYPPGSTVWSWGYCWQHSSSTPRMPSRCCSACSHAGSQCPHNSAKGELLHGWHRWWLYHLVKNQGPLCAGKDITYRQHFSQCNCSSNINLKL